MKTAVDFENKVEELDLQYWGLRECSICNEEIGYYFDGGKVFFDSSCGCASSPWQESSYEHIADFYNRQYHPEVIEKLNRFWKF